MLSAFKRIFTKNYELSQVQNAIEQALSPVLSSVIIDGVLINDIALTTTAKEFSHTLNRQPLGYIIVKRNANATVYHSAINSNTITLLSSATTTVSLWIF